MAEKTPHGCLIDFTDFYWDLDDYKILLDCVRDRLNHCYPELDARGQKALSDIAFLLSIFENHHNLQKSRLKSMIEEHGGSKLILQGQLIN